MVISPATKRWLNDVLSRNFSGSCPRWQGLYTQGGWQYIPGICLVYTPQFGLSIYRPYIQRFARNYFLLISTSSLKNSRTGAHFYPNRKTGKKFKRMPKKQPPPNTNTIKNRRLAPTYCSWYRGAIQTPAYTVLSNIYQAHTWYILLLNIGDQYVIGIYPVYTGQSNMCRGIYCPQYT